MVSFSSGQLEILKARSNRKLFSFFNFMGCDDNHLLLAAVTKISIIYLKKKKNRKQNCCKQRKQFLLQPRLLPMQMAPHNW